MTNFICLFESESHVYTFEDKAQEYFPIDIFGTFVFKLEKMFGLPAFDILNTT